MKPRSIFNEPAKFEIDTSYEGGKAHVKVTLNVSTINNDYEKHAKNFEKGPLNNVNFTIENLHKLTITATMFEKFDAETDTQFRKAIGVASRHNLHSTDVDKILKQYEKFGADIGYIPEPKQKPSM